MSVLKVSLTAGAVCASLAVCAVDWQFTGATNRTCAASVETTAAALPLRVYATDASAPGNFEARLTDSKFVSGCNFSSKGKCRFPALWWMSPERLAI